MKTTLKKTLDAFYLLNSLNSVRMKSTATSRKLFGLKALVKPAFEFYQEEERKIIADLPAAMDKYGIRDLKEITEGRAP